ncbi:MAG: murein hydrolase activator EnvC family protein [Candidatus Limnocylindrales bacterium]
MTTARLVRPLLICALMVGLFGGSLTPGPVRGNDLTQAQAQQRAIAAQLAAQKAKMAQLAALQADLATALATTKAKLVGINSDLADVKAGIATTQTKINAVQAEYNQEVVDLGNLDLALIGLDREEQQKAADLAQAKALLADHIRAAYEQDRTSVLETILSAASFTDAVGDIGNLIDFGDQDHVLANQIGADQAALFALDETTTATRIQTQQLAIQTAAQKTQLDASLASLAAAKAQLAILQAATSKALAIQQATFRKLSNNAAALKHAINAEAAAEAAAERRVQQILDQGGQNGSIPSQYNGTLSWPISGTVTQEFGCTGFPSEPPLGSCPHFHNGIDIADPMDTPIHASGAGRVVFAGPLSDGAWVVMIAHSTHLVTWYAHVDDRRGHTIPVHVGDWVTAGQVIAYVGMTGNTTGPHCHWMTVLNGTAVNPRLFL